jgi:predicted adenine nucleotide alpha hydrolase (AANH) superfamily ATPase
MVRKKILVHICCAPDGLYVMDLLKNNFEAAGYFYNPNIHPREEFDLRLAETRRTARIGGFDLIEGPYDADRWKEVTLKFKDEPEKGLRCDICYALRLALTARTAAQRGFPMFTTVMSLSPWKKADVMNRQGRMLGRRYGVEFLEANFKKKDGFRKSILMSRQHDIYRQNYCGCLYSLRDKDLP